MKKIIPVLFLFCLSILNAQEKSTLTVDKIEKEVQSYIARRIKTFELPAEVKKQIRYNISHDNPDQKPIDEKMIAELETNAKQQALATEFFNKNPKLSAIYGGSTSNRGITQICSDGGFENGDLSPYVFRKRTSNTQSPYSGTSTNIVTTGPDFGNLFPAPSTNINNPTNSYATLVGPGDEPTLLLSGIQVPKTHNGSSRAIKLNLSQTAYYDVITMSRNFTINDNFFDFNYSLVVQNINHPAAEQPFFEVRIYNATKTEILRTVSIVPFPDDCLLNSAANGTILYSGWECGRINTSDLIGTDVVVEFIVSDCVYGVHFGTVYIDDICSSTCSDPTFGSINLNPLPTITCPTSDQTICGTYTAPQGSQYNSMVLEIRKMPNNTLVSTISAPTTLTPGSGNTQGTFCFTVPVSAFGNNPNGDFDFVVRANFERVCSLGNVTLNPIIDKSTNNSGPDVSFVNCINAVDDTATFSTCSLGSFSILNNDSIYGNPITISNVILTQTSAAIPQLTLDTVSGLVNVTPGTTQGTYSLTYRICNVNNPTHCDTATVTVTVNGITIDAVNNDFSATPINACLGGNTTSVFANDQLCGANVSGALVTASLVSPISIPGASITNDGRIVIPQGSTPGTYTLTYQICQTSSSTNCDTATVVIVIAPSVSPTFNILTSLCYGTTAPILPTLSNNGINGTWSPSAVSNTTPGNYTFTPVGQCAASVTISVNIIQQCGFALSWGTAVNCQLASGLDPRKSYDPDIAGGQCIRICENSTVTYTLSGPTNIIQHTDWVVTGGQIVTALTTNTTCTINWSSANFCSLQGTIFLTNGTQVAIDKCIEKVKAPKAFFGVRPEISSANITTCVNNLLSFENLSSHNGGNDILYYNWDFGDQIGTSTEFEPTYSYTRTGDYEVVLTVFNGCSCKGTYSIKVHVTDATLPIQCPSVVCEGDRSTYSISPELSGERCNIRWTVTGGEIVSPNPNNAQIDIVWNSVDEDGFGYLYAQSDQCLKCTSSVKIPVVKQHGRIKGSSTICIKSQNIYSLPQWPSTEFNWSINDNGTGAMLYTTNQRNEIIVQTTDGSGYIDLYCTYKNTLLGCGGNATLRIYIKPSVVLDGSRIICKNTAVNYQINDTNGNPITSINWSITGPNNYNAQGSTSPFTISFPKVGIYYFTVNSSEYCPNKLVDITVTENPPTPVAINGPLVICPGTPENYSVAPVAGTIPHWSIPNNNGTIYGSATGNQVLVNFDPNATTNYVLSVYYEAEGCNSGVKSITLNRVIPDLSLIQNDATVCGSNTGTYSINDIQAENYIWTIEPQSAGSIQSGQNSPSVVILWNQAAQIAHVKLKVRKCGKEYQLPSGYPVTITNSPTVVLTPIAPTCNGQTVTAQFSLNPASSFTSATWDFGDGTAPQTFYAPNYTASHVYNNPLTSSATYNLTVTVNGAGGCLMPSTATTSVVVSPAPVIDISPKNNLNLCNASNIPSDYVYSVNIQGGFIPTQSIQWYHNGALMPGANTASITIPQNGNGTYYATVTNTLNCTSRTATITAYSSCGEASCASNNPIDASITVGCQSVTATAIITGTPIDVFWSNIDFSGATILSNGNPTFQAENMNPGQYNIQINASYNENNLICYAQKHISFIIPYRPDLKYVRTCNGTSYSIRLLDHSVYYQNTPIELYEFTTDNGATWQNGTVIDGINQLVATLAPGVHYIGIRISRPSDPLAVPCEKIIPLVLPAIPNATFTHSNNVCQGTAMNFYANTQPDSQYNWTFEGNVNNLQQNPIRTFNSAGQTFVSLTVTNAFGCSATSNQSVNIIPTNMSGTLSSVPANICQNNPAGIALTYTPSSGSSTPTNFYWYNSNNTLTPFTNTTSPNTIVHASGQYYVYTEDSNHCMNYKTQATTAAFIPSPEPPSIVGKSTVCAGSTYSIKIPANNSLQYHWFLDNVAQPQWDNATEIFDSQTSGTYTYSVVAQTMPVSGISCSSAPASYTVTVLETPEIPQLIISNIGCDDYYYVDVDVVNPQSGVSYYWSNGNTGTHAHITHDGPIQVQAVANDCSSEAQIDLPVNLNTLTWIFPRGCYGICKEDHFGNIIGPLGEYVRWAWIRNDYVAEQGNGQVPSFSGVEPTHNFQLFLANGFCRIKTDYMEVSEKSCSKCDIKHEITNINCKELGAYFVYRVTIQFDNPYGSNAWTTLTAPDNQGYFVESTILLPPGVSTHTFLFYVTNGFVGGPVKIKVNGHWKDNNCLDVFTAEFPEICGTNPRLSQNNDNEDLLIFAPNPASVSTTVFYQYADTEQNIIKTLEIRDTLGRVLQTIVLDDPKGVQTLDCSQFASGQYFVLLKAGNQLIKSGKLMIGY